MARESDLKKYKCYSCNKPIVSHATSQVARKSPLKKYKCYSCNKPIVSHAISQVNHMQQGYVSSQEIMKICQL